MEAKADIAEFKPKKALNMQQLFENMKTQMDVHLGSDPADVIPVGFRIYALDQKKRVLAGTSFLSKGINLESFGSEDQAVKIDPSLPEDERRLLMRATGIVFALLEGISSQDTHALEACSSLWEEAKSAREKAPTIENILWTLYEAMDHHKDWEDLESEKDGYESDLQEKEEELWRRWTLLETAKERIIELENEIATLKEEE